jgi:hypothetical protein
VGTPGYAAPEQVGGQPVDHRSDLFGLGCVLYALCTGDAPFEGGNTFVTLMASASARPEPPREVNPEVPPALSELVMHLLAKDPARRPTSARAVAATLARLEQAAGRPSRRRRVLAAVAVLAAALGVVLWLTLRTTTGRLEIVAPEDADVQVFLEREGGKVIVMEPRREHATTVRAGTWHVRLGRGGHRFEVEPATFTLARGGRQVLTVRRRAGPPGGG